VRATGGGNPQLATIEHDYLVLVGKDDEVTIPGQHAKDDPGDGFDVEELVHGRICEPGPAAASVNLCTCGEKHGRRDLRREGNLDGSATRELKYETIPTSIKHHHAHQTH
jgi:hypothetical protein